MFWEILVVILITSIVQSVFGVGVLLLGTPTLVALGIPFFEVLAYLLPTSIAISSIQVIEFNRFIDKKFIKNILVFTIPIIPLGMWLTDKLGGYVALFLGLFLLISTSNKFFASLFNVDNNRKYLSFGTLGFLHGLTNLGGSLLPAFVNHKDQSKEQKLSTVAAAYALFGIIQILFIFILRSEFGEIGIWLIGTCVGTGVIGNRIIGVRIYKRISRDRYSHILKYYVLGLGAFLVIRSVLKLEVVKIFIHDFNF